MAYFVLDLCLKMLAFAMNVQVVDLFAIYPIITDRLKCFEHVLFEMSEIIDNLITVRLKVCIESLY